MAKKHHPTTLTELGLELADARDDVIVTAAALQLTPENASKWMRFERLVESALSAPATEPSRQLTAPEVRRLMTTPPIADQPTLQAEDPFEESFTAEISFFGGSYTVVSGGTAAAHSACQRVLEAANRLAGTELEWLQDAIFTEAHVALRLSSEICRRAGLGRWVPTKSTRGEPFVMPDSERLATLRNAVVFTDQDLVDLLGPYFEFVQHLIAPEVMPTDPERFSPTDDRMYVHPLVRLSNGNLAIAIPGALALSVAHRALFRAAEAGGATTFIGALLDSGLNAAGRCLQRLRWQQIDGPNLEKPIGFAEDFWRFDRNLIAHVIVLADPLTDYEIGRPFDPVDMSAIAEGVQRRIAEVKQSYADGSGILHLVLMASLGRSFAMGFGTDTVRSGDAFLHMTVDQLDIITGLLDADPLELWNFAKASNRLHERTHVASFSKLDEFALYVENGRGFYLGDDALPDMLTIQVGMGRELLMTERVRRDPHSLVFNNNVNPVSRWDADSATPIYAPDNPSDSAARIVELGVPICIWPSHELSDPPQMSNDLVDVAAFWIWRAADQLEPALSVLSRSNKPVIVNVRLEPQTSLQSPPTEWLACEPSAASRSISLTLNDGASEHLRGHGNEGERRIATALVRAMFVLAGLDHACDEEKTLPALPQGETKMCHVFGDGDDLLFLLGESHKPRLVNDAHVEAVLDECGAFCREELDLTVGPIPNDDRLVVLNKVVEHLFQELKTRIDRLSPEDLLEGLVSEQEAIVFTEGRNRLQLPCYEACFGRDSSSVRGALKIQRKLPASSVANRFLIECVTAMDPTGTDQFSTDTYDRLLALAREITEWGHLSDALRHGLSSSELSLLPSGRLGSSRDEPFHLALTSHSELTAIRSAEAARRAFPRHWSSVAPSTPPDASALDDALVAEFGFTASELSRFAGDLMQIARDAPHQVALVSEGQLLERLRGSLGWNVERLGRAIDLFALRKLEKFLPDENSRDCYPWLFSRDRSASRRPLCVRTSGAEAEIIWGSRSVYRSLRHLHDLIMTNRLKAKSKPMADYMTAAKSSASRAFNEDVARAFESPELIVRQNVKKFGPLRLTRENGEHIGDVDVLVVSPKDRVLLAVEVKDFEFARTPAELRNELNALAGPNNSAATHHQERVAFIRSNLSPVLAALGLEQRSDWQVRGLVVTSADLLAARFPLSERAMRGLDLMSFASLLEKAATLTKRREVNRSTSRAKRRRRR